MTKSKCRQFLAFVLAMVVLSTSSSDQNVVADDVADAAQKAAGVEFDRAVFGARGDHSVAPTLTRFNRILKQRIEAVDHACGLSDAQKKKLELAGRGAIKQLVESIDEQKKIFLSVKDKQSAFDFIQQHPEIDALRVMFRSAPFGDDTLFAKTLRNVLTPEQVTKYDQRSTLAATSNKKISVANAGDLVRTAKLKKDAFQIIWNRDGKHVAFVEFNKHVEVYLPAEDRVVRKFGEEKRVVGFDFGPNDKLVAIGENSKDAVIINLAEGNEIQLHTDHHQPSVKFSPDGKVLATGGYGTKAKLWSTATGQLVREFDVGPNEGGLTPVFSPDGTVLAVGHRNSTTRVFNAVSGRLLHVLDKSSSQGLSFDSTGKTLAVVYVDGSFALWDVPTGKLKNTVQTPGDEVYTVDWTPNASVLVTAGHNSQVTLWNSADLSVLSELESPEWVVSARFSPDGTKLLFAGGNLMSRDEKHIETWAVP